LRFSAVFLSVLASALLLPAALLSQVSASPTQPRQRAGRYEVTLHPPAGGLRAGAEMEIEFQVLDFGAADAAAAGGGPAPVLFAQFRCEVDMPSMPSMPRFDEIAHREGVPGVYGVHPTFPHGGDYRLCITLLPPAEQVPMTPKPDGPFTLEFPLEVGDASSGRRPFSEVRPYRLEVLASPSPPAAGEETELELRVRMENSPDLREVTDFDLVHERLMHLFLVRRDLGYFAHEHPELVAPGVFRLRLRFPAPGEWRLFADVAPRDAGGQVLLAKLTVRPGEGDPPPPSPMPDGAVLSAAADGVRADLEIPGGGIPAGRTVTVVARLTDAKGRPVEDLEPWLGALGHLLLIPRDAETFAHAHPDERVPGAGRGGRIPFLVRLPQPGLYRGWLQFQRGGRVVTEEIALEALAVSPGESAARAPGR
jgi:hypothetical protein